MMASFELCSGLLTLCFLFNFPNAYCKSELVLPLTHVRAVFERTSMVKGEGSGGHCRSWCIQRELTSLCLENQNIFTPGKHVEISNLEDINSMNR